MEPQPSGLILSEDPRWSTPMMPTRLIRIFRSRRSGSGDLLWPPVAGPRLGGDVARTGSADTAKRNCTVLDDSGLFAELPETQDVWMSHGDAVVEAPAGFRAVAQQPGRRWRRWTEQRRYGVQFIEVAHTPRGTEILKRFLLDVCQLRRRTGPTIRSSSNWSMPSGSR